MKINSTDLDRHITGNYGEDQPGGEEIEVDEKQFVEWVAHRISNEWFTRDLFIDWAQVDRLGRIEGQFSTEDGTLVTFSLDVSLYV